MDDLVTQLRAWADRDAAHSQLLQSQAADEIKHLRACLVRWTHTAAPGSDDWDIIKEARDSFFEGSA